ncbi:g1605 [Coccomyxa elongata]
MGARRGPGAKVARGGSPLDAAGVKKRNMAPANGLRHDAHALMALAAATQHAAGQDAPPRLPQPVENYLEPAARQESVSSDNDYSEEQYQMEKQQLQQQQQQRSAPRSSGGGGGTAESEEEKKEKRRLANREAARRMRRRRATHMAAVEEEVERLSQENSLLLHRMSQLVASHQAVDAENAQLRADLMTLRASVGACLQAGQLEMAAPSLAAAVSNGAISPSLVVPVPRPAAVTAVPTGEPVAAERAAPAAAPARRLVEPQERAGGLPPMAAAGGQASGVPSSSGGQSTENEMTATEEERARYSGGNAPARPDGSFATSGEALPSASRTQRKKGSAWKAAGSWLADN